MSKKYIINKKFSKKKDYLKKSTFNNKVSKMLLKNYL